MLDFEPFPEESFGRLAPLDTTARSTERKKIKRGVLFKESLCIVNRIKGDGESHLSLSNVSPGHSCAAPLQRRGFGVAALRNPQPSSRDFLYRSICRHRAQPKPQRCIPPPPPLPWRFEPCSTEGNAGSSQGLLCSAQRWGLVPSPKTSPRWMLRLRPDPDSVSLLVSLSRIPTGRGTRSPLPPPSLCQAPQLFACLGDTNSSGCRGRGAPDPGAWTCRWMPGGCCPGADSLPYTSQTSQHALQRLQALRVERRRRGDTTRMLKTHLSPFWDGRVMSWAWVFLGSKFFKDTLHLPASLPKLRTFLPCCRGQF